jgi:maltoporin
MKLRQTLLAMAVLGLVSTGASAFEFGGYFRIGPGQKTTGAGDGSRCFDGATTNGHGGIGRLGNECHTYGELGLSHTGDVGGIKFKALWMPNFFEEGSNPDTSKVNAAQQLFVEAKGFDIAPNQSFWVGKRFYHRADVHFDDAFFVNPSGTGAGVDGIPVGSGSLGLAVFRQDDNGNAISRFNADLENLDVNPGGKLRVTLALTEGSGANGKGGTGISLQHTQSKLLAGGDNTLWVQYAQGSASISMGSGSATAGSDVKTSLIADSLAWLNGPLTAQTLVQLGEAKDGANKRKFNSIGGRVAYAFTNHFKLQAELGMNTSKPTGGSSERVTKLTIAPTLTVGKNYYDRPELRLYASYFSFNDAYRAAHGLTKSSKTAIGAQVEVWF